MIVSLVLALSLGAVAAPPPDVTGEPVTVAVGRLQDWRPGLTIRLTPPPASLPPGADPALAVVARVGILNTDGKPDPDGTVAELTLAARVPPLVGVERGAAGTLVRRHGLVPVFAPLETSRLWTVRSQYPPEGTLVAPGSRVSIVVGPPLSPSPSPSPPSTTTPPVVAAEPPEPFPTATVLTLGGTGLLLLLLLLAGLLLRRGGTRPRRLATTDVSVRPHPGPVTGPTLTDLGGPSLSVRLLPHWVAATHRIEDTP